MICREVLDDLMEACNALGIEQENIPHWKAQEASLPRYLLDEEGGLKEWAWPTVKENYDHRHVDGYAIDDMNQYGDFDDVAYVQAAAALNEEDGELAVFVINADWEDAQAFTLDARGFEGWRFAEHLTMACRGEEPRMANLTLGKR